VYTNFCGGQAYTPHVEISFSNCHFFLIWPSVWGTFFTSAATILYFCESLFFHFFFSETALNLPVEREKVRPLVSYEKKDREEEKEGQTKREKNEF
jgi:hypothetical protein